MRAGELIGRAVANAVNLLSPDAVALGGTVVRGAPVLLAEVKRTVEMYVQPYLRNELAIVEVETGADAPLLGAARMAMDASGASSLIHRSPFPIVLGLSERFTSYQTSLFYGKAMMAGTAISVRPSIAVFSSCHASSSRASRTWVPAPGASLAMMGEATGGDVWRTAQKGSIITRGTQ